MFPADAKRIVEVAKLNGWAKVAVRPMTELEIQRFKFCKVRANRHEGLTVSMNPATDCRKCGSAAPEKIAKFTLEAYTCEQCGHWNDLKRRKPHGKREGRKA